jgi:NAD-dependent deacetylase
MAQHPGIVLLTGAGISRESGLATFRDADGIWAKVRIEDVATPEAFAREPGAGARILQRPPRAAP